MKQIYGAYVFLALLMLLKRAPEGDAKAFNIKIKHWMTFFKVILLICTVMIGVLKLS